MNQKYLQLSHHLGAHEKPEIITIIKMVGLSTFWENFAPFLIRPMLCKHLCTCDTLSSVYKLMNQEYLHVSGQINKKVCLKATLLSKT